MFIPLIYGLLVHDPILQLTSQYNVIRFPFYLFFFGGGKFFLTCFQITFFFSAILFFLQFVLPEESLSQLTHRIVIHFPLFSCGESPRRYRAHPRLILWKATGSKYDGTPCRG